MQDNEPQGTNASWAKPRVFIADHSPAVIERVCASIDDVALVLGYATNARDTIAGVRRLHPQLTLLDIAVDNGFDLLRQIKRHLPPVIVAVLTLSADDTTRRYCLRCGADYFLDKLREFEKVREIVIAIGSGHQVLAVIPPTLH